MSNFKIWIDDGKVNDTNTVNKNDFLTSSNSERVLGFKPGTPSSSSYVNTALRQANLVTCALMEEILGENTSLDFSSNVADVKTVINDYLTNKLTTKKSKIAEYASEDIEKGKIENRLENIETPMTSYDNSKGTIEERLTSLGFKEGNIIDSSNNIVGKITRQGNYVLMKFTSSIIVSSSSDKLFDITVSSSSGYDKTVFYPKDEQKRILHIQDGGGMLFGFVEKNKNKPIRFSSTLGNTVSVTENNSFGWEVK